MTLVLTLVLLSDDVEIVGVIMHKWKPFLPTVRCEAELVLVANNVQVRGALSLCFRIIRELVLVANNVQVSGAPSLCTQIISCYSL